MSHADMIAQASASGFRNCLNWAAAQTYNLQAAANLTPRLSLLLRGNSQSRSGVTLASRGACGWGLQTSNPANAGLGNLQFPQVSQLWKPIGTRGHQNFAPNTPLTPPRCQGGNPDVDANPKSDTNPHKDNLEPDANAKKDADFQRQQDSNGAQSRIDSSRSASTSSRSGVDCADLHDENGLRVAVGSIHIIMGPMFAGKTTALLARMQEAVKQGKKVALVKSGIDVRYGLLDVVSHDGTCMPCLAVDTLADFRASIGDQDYDGLDVIGIDEAQFFTDLDAFCRRAADRDHKEVIIAGLDGDFKRRKFGQLLDLVPTADSIVKLSATCELCRQPAFFTLRKTEETETQVVGGADKYMPVCRAHWVEGNYAIKVARTFLRGSESVSESREPTSVTR